MSLQQRFQVAGVDGCRAGWLVAVTVAAIASRKAPGCTCRPTTFLVARTFAQVLKHTASCKLTCIDIPIGLSNDQPSRQCDVMARRILGRPRAAGIFPPPPRPSLAARDYDTAAKICYRHTGKRMNKQTFFLLDKIRQVDDLMTPTIQRRVREILPEVSFWALNGRQPVRLSKKDTAGRAERTRLLAPIFSNIEHIVTRTRKPAAVAPDDILDALVAAWSAAKVILNQYTTLPEQPQLDEKGLRMEILSPIT